MTKSIGLGKGELTQEQKNYFLVSECKEDVQSLQGQQAAGYPTEFKSFGNNITFKPGYHCIVAASPASGKSFWTLHTNLHLAKEHKQKCFVFSPELGNRAEIIALLVHMHTGKTVYEIEGMDMIGPEELIEALRWLNKYFIILDGEKHYSLDDIYEEVDKCEIQYNIKISNIIIDNLNDIKEPIDSGGRQDLGVEQMLSSVRRYNKKKNCFTFMVTHSSSQGAPITQNNITYYRPITPREIRSGEAVYRKAFLLLTLWRPPFGLNDETGRPYEKNETHIICLKGKPANTATKGFVGRVFFDYKKASFTDEIRPHYIKLT